MKAYLLLDVGSTYTKLTAVDIENNEILGTSRALTTVTTDIIEGFRVAEAELHRQLKGREVQVIRTLACSSAAGGLKMIAVGLAKNLTSEAAKRAALGAGARLLKVYSYELSDEDIREMESLHPDILLLSGGTDGGNEERILFNAGKLTALRIRVPIVIAGNRSASERVRDLFENAGMASVVTENVMPQVNELNAGPVREVIREIFMKRIVEAKGMDHVSEITDGLLMPTPAAVLQAAELLSTGTEESTGIGNLAVVDVGGATTDVHSIGTGLPEDDEVRFEVLKEPFAKRTVEGDLGMRYSAWSLYEAVGEETLKKYLPGEPDIPGGCRRRAEKVDMVPLSDEEIAFDEGIATAAVDHAIRRHAGRLKKQFTQTRHIYYQEGKDLRNWKALIGTGGVLVHSRDPKSILSAGFFSESEPEVLKPIAPKLLLDGDYILSAMGLLAMELPESALAVMKKYLVEI